MEDVTTEPQHVKGSVCGKVQWQQVVALATDTPGFLLPHKRNKTEEHCQSSYYLCSLLLVQPLKAAISAKSQTLQRCGQLHLQLFLAS